MKREACWGIGCPLSSSRAQPPPNQGHAFLAIDVPATTPIQTFKGRIDRMIRDIKNAPRSKGTDRIYLPGEMEREHQEAALRDGMRLPDYVIVNLLRLGREGGTLGTGRRDILSSPCQEKR